MLDDEGTAGVEMGLPAGTGEQPDLGKKEAKWVWYLKEESEVPVIIERAEVNRDGVSGRLTVDIPSCPMADYVRGRTGHNGTSIHQAEDW